MRDRIRSASQFEDRYGFVRAVRAGRRIEIAGTAPIPQDDSPLPASAGDQMRLCAMIAIGAIESLGGSVDQVVRTRMYITDPADADEIGLAHREMFGEAAPVATMVVVAQLLDPRWRVEIEVEAELTDDGE